MALLEGPKHNVPVFSHLKVLYSKLTTNTTTISMATRNGAMAEYQHLPFIYLQNLSVSILKPILRVVIHYYFYPICPNSESVQVLELLIYYTYALRLILQIYISNASVILTFFGIPFYILTQCNPFQIGTRVYPLPVIMSRSIEVLSALLPWILYICIEVTLSSTILQIVSVLATYNMIYIIAHIHTLHHTPLSTITSTSLYEYAAFSSILHSPRGRSYSC